MRNKGPIVEQVTEQWVEQIEELYKNDANYTEEEEILKDEIMSNIVTLMETIEIIQEQQEFMSNYKEERENNENVNKLFTV
mgnify:CR=1 FL=1|jgi:hypothetical protein